MSCKFDRSNRFFSTNVLFSAGVTGIIKTTKIMSMLSADFGKFCPSIIHPGTLSLTGCALADGIDLFIWGNAECAITIIAASIPVLRVLVRDATYSRRYYKSEDSKQIELKGSSTEGNHHSRTLTAGESEKNLVLVSVTGGGPKPVLADGRAPGPGVDEKTFGDNWRGPRTTGLSGQNQIVRTEDFSLEYHNRKSMANDSI